MYQSTQSQNKQEDSPINLDFSNIERLDPCLEGGYVIIFDQQLPFLIRFLEAENQRDDKHTIEMLRVRVMILGKPRDFSQMTLELTSESDLFFYYFHTVDQQNFQLIKTSQQLSVEFKEYPEVCIKCLQKCQNEQQQFAPVLNLMMNQRAKLQILQTLEYKELEIISFEMIAGDEDIIRQNASFKYGSVKSKFQIIESRLKDINDLVRTKNPQLLLHIQKYMQQNKS